MTEYDNMTPYERLEVLEMHLFREATRWSLSKTETGRKILSLYMTGFESEISNEDWDFYDYVAGEIYKKVRQLIETKGLDANFEGWTDI